MSAVSDVVYLLTSDEDARDGKWTVAANATPVKNSIDVVGFQLDRLTRGRSVPLTLCTLYSVRQPRA